jgi:hypothetical protein
LTASATPPASPPPPIGTTTCANVVEQLHTEPRLPADDVLVVERVHERPAVLVGVRPCAVDARVDRVAALAHLGAERLDGRDLGDRGGGRHVDEARYPAGARCVGERLGVVAGAAGHDARCPVVERGELREGAAELERAGALEVLGFDDHVSAAAVGEALEAEDRGVPGDRARVGVDSPQLVE